MFELRNAAPDPRPASLSSSLAASATTAPPPRQRGALGTLSRAAVSLLPWLLLGAGCLGEEDTGDPALEQDEQVGQDVRAGSGGSSAQGTGGSRSGNTTAMGGSSAQSPTAGSGSMSMEPGGSTSALDAAPGETGIFVGMTAAHNLARRSLDLDPPLPDLTWSEELAEFAQEWAETLARPENCGVNLFHRDQNMYGENIAYRGTAGRSTPYAPEEAVESWFAEIDCWEYGTIRGTESCDMACIRRLSASGCGHFTQIAWRNTREVGCGYATCNDGRLSNEIWVCNYDPPGNYIGQTPY